MTAALILLLLSSIQLSSVYAQKQTLTPGKTVVQFYRLLKEKKYIDGFKLSVYRWAVEGLKPEELKELEPDFTRTFSEIPDKIDTAGEQINGDTAVVFLKYKGADQPQPIGLVLVEGEWLVGDKESMQLVRTQGAGYFFNARVAENENEVFRLMLKIVGAEMIYSQKFQSYASMEELIKLSGVPKEIQDAATLGYRITLTLGADRKTYYAQATPVAYAKTGKLSFYADAEGVRAEDLKGGMASATSPLYQIR
jgi:hypothetical protein